MINKKKHRLSIKTRFDTQMDSPSKTRTNSSDPFREILINGLISISYKISMIFAYLIDDTYFRLKIKLGVSKMGKELRESNEEITIIGIVKEFEEDE